MVFDSVLGAAGFTAIQHQVTNVLSSATKTAGSSIWKAANPNKDHDDEDEEEAEGDCPLFDRSFLNDARLSAVRKEALFRVTLRETFTAPFPSSSTTTATANADHDDDDPFGERPHAEDIAAFLEEYRHEQQRRRRAGDGDDDDDDDSWILSQVIGCLLSTDPNLQRQFDRLVPERVSFDDFWQRYFYRCECERIQMVWDAAGLNEDEPAEETANEEEEEDEDKSERNGAKFSVLMLGRRSLNAIAATPAKLTDALVQCSDVKQDMRLFFQDLKQVASEGQARMKQPSSNASRQRHNDDNDNNNNRDDAKNFSESFRDLCDHDQDDANVEDSPRTDGCRRGVENSCSGRAEATTTTTTTSSNSVETTTSSNSPTTVKDTLLDLDEIATKLPMRELEIEELSEEEAWFI